MRLRRCADLAVRAKDLTPGRGREALRVAGRRLPVVPSRTDVPRQRPEGRPPDGQHRPVRILGVPNRHDGDPVPADLNAVAARGVTAAALAPRNDLDAVAPSGALRELLRQRTDVGVDVPMQPSKRRLPVVPTCTDVVGKHRERRPSERQLGTAWILGVPDGNRRRNPGNLHAVSSGSVTVGTLAPCGRQIQGAHGPSMIARMMGSDSSAGKAVALITLKDTATRCTSRGSVIICPWPQAPST